MKKSQWNNCDKQLELGKAHWTSKYLNNIHPASSCLYQRASLCLRSHLSISAGQFGEPLEIQIQTRRNTSLFRLPTWENQSNEATTRLFGEVAELDVTEEGMLYLRGARSKQAPQVVSFRRLHNSKDFGLNFTKKTCSIFKTSQS